MLTPSQRADLARKLLEYYHGYDPGDEEATIAGLLADLMHLCEREGYNWEERLGSASMHWSAECEEERDV